jgi:glycosyltransferase involved in cell wall biosynthesis
MRVLHVTPYFAPAFVYGGPPRSVLGLCRALQRAGARVEVVTTTANGTAELPLAVTEQPTFDGVPVTYVPRSFPKQHFRAAALTRVLDAHADACDLVHVHGCWNLFGWAAARWCRRVGKPYGLSPRGMLHPWSFDHRPKTKWLSYQLVEAPTLRGARFLHATSEQEAEVIARLRLGPQVVIVPNGLDDLEEPLPIRSDAFRARFGVQPGDFLVLFLGRLHPKKGLDTLIAATRRMAADRPEARLLVVGTGDPRFVRSLQTSARDLLDGGRIRFAGHLTGDDRRLALTSADAFALTSHSENFGLSVAEAMAAGLPVVVSRNCPWPQIDAWRAGFWVDNDAALVSTALTALACDRPAARAMGENGRREIRAYLCWDRLAGEMLAAYRLAVENR